MLYREFEALLHTADAWTVFALDDPEDKAEVEVSGELYVVIRERDIHAVAATRVEDGQTGLYL